MATAVKLSTRGSELLQPHYTRGVQKQDAAAEPESESEVDEVEDAEEGDAQPVVNSELTRKILRTLQPRKS